MDDRDASTAGGIPPHGDARILRRAPGGTAARAVIMVHGRGASAQDILTLAAPLGLDDALLLAPQANGHTWYPFSFLAPMAQNEPGITSGIALLESLVRQVESDGVPASRIALLGFSQGACLTTEFVARHPRPYGAVLGFSGGLIGPPGTLRDYPGSLDDTPVFLGCSDVDPHIPAARVQETATVLAKMGARVDLRLYPGMPHTINNDELAAGRALLDTLSPA
ncbi:MAG: dienelactone hydrolase family protein [Gemmatimonadaceae bacterium]|nr:dienelactone hydrolase family protein [Gemmatimonadaceae bacterium]